MAAEWRVLNNWPLATAVYGVAVARETKACDAAWWKCLDLHVGRPETWLWLSCLNSPRNPGDAKRCPVFP